jgi:formylglycine-generating enzyme required for sulfatase activity
MGIIIAVAAGHALMAQETELEPARGEGPAASGPEVTLKGIMMWEISCVPKPTKEDHDKKTMVLFAVEGTPEVAAALDAIMKEHWPGDSMNGTQARNLNEGFGKRLKYYITPGEIATKNSRRCRWRNPMIAVTGVVSEKDGKKWITPTRIEGSRLKYPDKMLAPDKPLKMPGKNPLILKVTDTLSLKCILLPRGEFLMAKPYYVDPRWQDEFPRHITLTKPFYLAEIPVTQKMWEAVMGDHPSTVKGPKLPVRNLACADVNRFCRILSEKNRRTVRLPGEAEWEYAARVGTSNPPLAPKYRDQDSSAPGRGNLLPVKSKEPNAWGLYDMINDRAFEMTRDKFIVGIRIDSVDPYDSCEREEAGGRKHGHWGRNNVTYHESVPSGGAKDDAQYGSMKFRVLVEATPEEIAEMEKAEKK